VLNTQISQFAGFMSKSTNDFSLMKTLICSHKFDVSYIKGEGGRKL